MFPIISKVSNCIDCYRCLRSCNVKAISFRAKQAKIMTDKCVLCGRCLSECPQHTKTVYSQEQAVRDWLAAGEKVVLSLSPTFISHFGCDAAPEVYARARALGFAVVEEMAVSGAEYLAQCREAMAQGSGRFYISSHCPVIINLVEKHFPHLLPHLLPVETPAVIHARSLRARYGQDIRVVVATACLSEMELSPEAELSAALSWQQLETLLREADPEKAAAIWEDEPDYQLIGQRLSLSGGLQGWLVQEGVLQEEQVQALSGMRDCLETLEGLDRELVRGLRFLELMGCRDGCTTGLELDKKGSILDKRLQMIKRQKRYQVRPMLPAGQVPYKARVFTDRQYVPAAVNNGEVAEVLASFKQYNRQTALNCGACGFDSCYEKAVAVVRGEAEQEMCMTYMRKRAESMAHTIVRSVPSAIIVFDKDFIIQEANPAAYEMFKPYGLKEGNALFESIDIRYMEQVVETGRGLRDKIVHYRDIDLWTRQIIVRMYDAKDMYLAIIEDITEQEKKRLELEQMKTETLEKANRVINNQMMVAQQIASLLGETTAETKITLLDLIKQFEREKELE